MSYLQSETSFEVTQTNHGFYALDVKYKNGQVQIYIADNGCSACVVASDFKTEIGG